MRFLSWLITLFFVAVFALIAHLCHRYLGFDGRKVLLGLLLGFVTLLLVVQYQLNRRANRKIAASLRDADDLTKETVLSLQSERDRKHIERILEDPL